MPIRLKSLFMQTLNMMIKIAILLALLGLAGCEQHNPAEEASGTAESMQMDSQQPAANVVGGDKDEHGCIGSAGYQWCASIQQCVRHWELAKIQNLADDSAQSIAAFCDPV
jgi:hypothetical protein